MSARRGPGDPPLEHGAIVRGSAANAKRFHNPELASAAGAAAYVDREWSEAAVHERYDWLFRYDAAAVDIESPREGAPA